MYSFLHHDQDPKWQKRWQPAGDFGCPVEHRGEYAVTMMLNRYIELWAVTTV